MDSKSQGPPSKTGTPSLGSSTPWSLVMSGGHVCQYFQCLSSDMSRKQTILQPPFISFLIFLLPHCYQSPGPAPASCWCVVLCHYVHFPNYYFPKLSIHLLIWSTFHAIIDAALFLGHHQKRQNVPCMTSRHHDVMKDVIPLQYTCQITIFRTCQFGQRCYNSINL